MTATILDLLSRHVGGDKIVRVSGKDGGLYHSPCPACGGTDRFMVFPDQPGGDLAQQHGVNGTWSCPRHCQKGGDIISFLQEFDGMSFAEACAELGISNSNAPRAMRPLRRPQAASASFSPIVYSAPSATWREHATKLATEAHAALLREPSALRWLDDRGLPLPAVQKYRLGWLAGEDKQTGTKVFRQRAAFGLPPKVDMQTGKETRVICIPRGITVPAWAQDGQCLRLRIRRPNKDIDKTNPRDAKYRLIPQPEPIFSAPLVLPPVGVSPELATWVVIEAELDAYAVHYACGGRVGVVAVLTVSVHPDAVAHAALAPSARILVALDFDQVREDGKPVPTAKAWPWWEATYPQARLWPVPKGKDPGEAYAQGVNLWDWVRSGMPIVAAPSTTAPEVGTMGPAPFVCPSGGRGVSAVASAVECPPVRPWPENFGDWMPPAVIVELAKFWRGKPVEFRKDADGGSGWRFDPDWAVKYPQSVHDFLTMGDSADVWRWLDEHEADVITSRNFLFIWG
ncbi:MAG: primase-helicase zinc-binding domain-containing protein [Desulfomicrobium sp.]|nr:primase-helicase zinc-binding domain-containing protein [Desulfomicrobium sp.]